MKIVKELLPGCFLLEPPRFEDERGRFVKTFHQNQFRDLGLDAVFRESFYSISRRNVIRGMHFQVPPHQHQKLVFCSSGAVRDVLLDLRRGDGYGKVASVNLSAENCYQVFIPAGIAHGFVTLGDEAILHYQTSTVHAPAFDRGIRWDSFGYDWGIAAPVLSPRDAAHPSFHDFESPFDKGL